MGNLTRDPDLKYTPSGAAVCNFGLAVNRKYKAGDDWNEEVTFVNITVWNKQGENCAEYLHKGSAVFLEGRLNSQQWETQDGSKRNKLEVVANTVQFLDKKPAPCEEKSGEDDIPF